MILGKKLVWMINNRNEGHECANEPSAVIKQNFYLNPHFLSHRVPFSKRRPAKWAWRILGSHNDKRAGTHVVRTHTHTHTYHHPKKTLSSPLFENDAAAFTTIWPLTALNTHWHTDTHVRTGYNTLPLWETCIHTHTLSRSFTHTHSNANMHTNALALFFLFVTYKQPEQVHLHCLSLPWTQLWTHTHTHRHKWVVRSLVYIYMCVCACVHAWLVGHNASHTIAD